MQYIKPYNLYFNEGVENNIPQDDNDITLDFDNEYASSMAELEKLLANEEVDEETYNELLVDIDDIIGAVGKEIDEFNFNVDNIKEVFNRYNKLSRLELVLETIDEGLLDTVKKNLAGIGPKLAKQKADLAKKMSKMKEKGIELAAKAANQKDKLRDQISKEKNKQKMQKDKEKKKAE